MAEMRRVTLPLTPDQARSLTVGEVVFADGEAVITAGFPTHQRIAAFLDEGKDLPLDLRQKALMHMGMYAREEGGRLTPLYVNPTTSTRFGAVMPGLIRRLGLTTVAGKGGLDRQSVEAMQEVGCVYMSMVGGASALLSAGVQDIRQTAWDDLIMQFRLTRIGLRGLGPLVVAIDAHGRSVYDEIAQSAETRLPAILANLAQERHHQDDKA